MGEKRRFKLQGKLSIHNTTFALNAATAMADSDPALLFAQYKIKEKIGMTPDLLLGSEFQQLAFKPLPTVNLAKEYEVSI